MTEFEAKAIAEAAAKAAVDNTLMRLGIDVNDPDGFAAVRADLLYVRSLREASDRVKSASISSLIGIVFMALAGVLVLGVRAWIAS